MMNVGIHLIMLRHPRFIIPFRKHFDEIINSFIYGFSNGPIEGSNNKIKSIKRTAYGFRSFKNFRLRILISFKNSFYSMNYKQKAADFNNVKSAA